MRHAFNYRTYERFPALGWAMIVYKDRAEIDVLCGSMVEKRDGWFVSGVWDGKFDDADFSSAEFFCATGAKIENDSVVVYSPTHERQRICYVEKDASLLFSNSIPLLLAVSGENIDKNCDQYEKILCSILWGTKEYTREVPIAGGKTLKQIFCADISVNGGLDINVIPKPIHRDFMDFNDYYESVRSVCARIRENGIDIGREHKLELAATASSGYDSSACAAVLKSVGCDTLMTFKGGFYDEDSAVKIAKQLGYGNIIERGHRDFTDKQGCKDAEYFVCGDVGVYLQFSAFEDDFAGRIVSIGTSGSYIWDKTGNVNPESKRSGYDFYTANLSFSENALIKGYVVLPLPLYASTAVQSIQRVSNLPEMKPWTLGTDYDRPICRRILEEAGVDGDLFGHKKYGAGFAMSKNFTKKQIKPKMSTEGYENFSGWLEKKENNKWSFGRVCRAVQYHFTSIPVYVGYVLTKLHIKNSLGKASISHPNPGIPAKLIVWGMETLTEKYRGAMKGN